MENGQEAKTVTELMDWIAGRICDDYCKYPDIAKGEVDDPDLADDHLYTKYCEHCPLSRL